MERAYHQGEAEQGPMVLERLSDLDKARERLGDFTDIRGMDVVNPTGDVVGTINELYVDPKEDVIVMAGITFGGRRVLIPVDELEMVGKDRIQVMTTPEIVENAPEFEEGVDAFAFHDYWCQAGVSQAAEPVREQTVTVVEVEEEEE